MTLAKYTPFSVDYAITVTLAPKIYRASPPIQYRETIIELTSILLKLGEFVIVPEVTKNYNVHYHIICKIPLSDKRKRKGAEYYIRNAFRNTKFFGFINIKQCDDVSGWEEYMFKDLPDTITLLNLDESFLSTKKENLEQYHAIHRVDGMVPPQ